MLKITQKGNFMKLDKYLAEIKKPVSMNKLKKFAEEGVRVLSSATPVDTGKTASSWYYDIKSQNGIITISFNNSNVNKGVPVAIVLQYGHGTPTGGWVAGRDYINPAIRPIFEKLVDETWGEVKRK